MEPIPREPDYSHESELAARVARVFGYDGLSIVVKPGAGWQTIHDEDDIRLIVDPTMLAPKTVKDASGEAYSGEVEIPAQYSVYGIAHELGHVDDFMHPDSLKHLKEAKPREHFFWNIVDDSVINKRLRNIPLLDSITDEVYRDMLFPKDDFTDKPKHVQFMYGWLLRNVVPDRDVTLDSAAEAALDGLESIELNGHLYDMYRTLSHPDTSYEERRRIAAEHILPLYEAFYEEALQDHQNQEQSKDRSDSDQQSDGESGSDSAQSSDSTSSPGSSSGSDQGGAEPAEWDEIYDAYADATGCGHENDDSDDSSSSREDPGTKHQDPHQAIKDAADAIRQNQQQQEHQPQPVQTKPNQVSNQPGSLAAELQLSPEDAAAYRAVVEQFRPQIQEVAKVFQLLAVPSVEYTSPRYQRRSDTSGLKLSPRDLYRVVVAAHSSADPAVWKPVETVAKREGYSFNGLDIHLLVDASGSMQGLKAENASASSVILMEGLASARRMVERYNTRAPKPDVRLQVILFGSDTKVVAPLSHEVAAKDKGIAFTTVRSAASNATMVNGALNITTANAQKYPERTQLVFVVTDGSFHDHTAAEQSVKHAPGNHFLLQYILQSPSTTAITKNASYLNAPTELPKTLQRQLTNIATNFSRL